MKSVKRFNLFPIKEVKIKGVALIELIVSIAIFSIIFYVLVSLIFTSIKVTEKLDGGFETSNDLNYALEYIINEIDKADYIMKKSVKGISKNSQLNIILVKDIGKEYSFVTFIIKDKVLTRLNAKKKKIENKIFEDYFSSFEINNNFLKNGNAIITNIKCFKGINKSKELVNIKIEDINNSEVELSYFLRGRIYE